MRYLLIIFGFFLLSCSRDFGELKQTGEELYKKGDYTASLSCFSEALLKNDTSEAVLFDRSKAYFKLGDNQRALSDLLKLVELGHIDYRYFNNIAMIYFLNEKYQSAAEYFDKAFQNGLNSHLSRYLLFFSHRRLKNYELADSINKVYFNNNYEGLYANFDKDFFDDDLFNLNGSSSFVFLMYFPKNRIHYLGEKFECLFFLVGNINTQTSEPSFYKIPNTNRMLDTSNRLFSKNGIGYFSLKTDSLVFKGDTLKREECFSARVSYKNNNGEIRDSTFGLVAELITIKTSANTVFKEN